MVAFSPTNPFATSLAFILFFLPLSSSQAPWWWRPPPPLRPRPRSPPPPPPPPPKSPPGEGPVPFPNIPVQDIPIIEFALNAEFAEAELFLHGTTGYGLDAIDPTLAKDGPPPVGGASAYVDLLTRDIFYQMGLQEVGHLRVILKTVKGFPRPLLNLSAELFADIMDAAFEESLIPRFAAYANSINFFITASLLPYVGGNGYIDALPKLKGASSRALVAGLLASEMSQDATIRTALYAFANTTVYPYKYTVADFTNKISEWRNRLGKGGNKDEGLIVPRFQGAEGKVTGNIQSGNDYSLIYSRTAEEILRIVYTTGNESEAGGLFPYGAGGTIAERHLQGG